MYNLQIRTQVKGDIQEIVDFYDRVSSKISDRFLDELYASWEAISENPALFQQKYKQTRVKYLRNYPFGVHYMVRDRTVIILAVIHTSRSPRKWQERS
ncbi:MAG: type II toxin-antitoxin system RelE/ParE family toxin [Roseivirga sp.]|jgi:plasmid stabilization system protein ParE|uniref:type II toxin-antitoxin system RelE/ParE family toxin n=1 Tax=Roseivirga sp. TaxID=1964215 RepID=UPI001B15E313|nr:type II toxin-antitoxin system RelE/ParE family toxin [Roseivirga sp.]MBO6496985.1 type II toxin-antitoxin system RelE/ParE family toxin [Roseivirga sp.]